MGSVVAIPSPVDLLEFITSLLGVVNVALLVRRSIWNYPVGMLMVALFAWAVFEARLYSDAALNIFFFVVQGYGWWAWWRLGGMEHKVAVERLTGPARIAWLVMILLCSFAWGAIMRFYTDAAFPWLDALLAMSSVAAQILLVRRRIENWPLWILVDVGYVAIYVVKHLYGFAALYLLLLLLSILGLREWARAEREAAA